MLLVDEDEDVFKKLPEDVFDCIVSFLSLKDLVKMSLVSRSWRNRWKTCQNLDFDLSILYPEEETGPRTLSKQKQLGYAKWVNQILASHHGESIELFRIQSCLPNELNAYVDQWIMFALQKKVRNLVLTDMPINEDKHGHVSRKYTLPFWISQKSAGFLNQLTLGNICLGNFEVSCTNHLTSLTLNNVFISDAWVHNMLQNCVHLRRLTLLRCSSLSISKLIIPRHIQLEHLSLFAGLKYLRQVEFEGGETLNSFECSFGIIKCCSIEKIPNLIKLSLLNSSSTSNSDSLRYVLTQLGLDHPRLEHLLLHFDNHLWPHKLYGIANPTTVSQLRFLSLSNFEVSAIAQFTRQIGFLLKMAPLLNTLELRGRFMSDTNEQEVTKRSLNGETHQNLKVVKIYGFQHCQTAVDLVIYLLEISVNLETLKIVRRIQSYMGNNSWTDEAKEELKCPAESISECFSKNISSSTKLVVL